MIKDSYILHIEDEPEIIEIVNLTLKFSGYNNIKAALSGKHGLDMIRHHKPDLLLLDLMMPEMSGEEVYREIKTDAQLADIPVIIITANIPRHGCFIYKDLPPTDDYITKPFDIMRLITAVQNVLESYHAKAVGIQSGTL